MKETRARISEIFSDSEGTGARIECEPPLRPTPGQYFLAHPLIGFQIQSIPLFAKIGEANSLVIPPPIPADWFPGLELLLRGPLGNGFHPPASAHHLLLADLNAHNGRRILSLAQQNTRPAEVVLLTDAAPAHLPVEIEVLPLKSLSEILPWADFIAVELTLQQIPELVRLAGLHSISEFPAFSEALIDTPLICGGIASCGVCSVRVNHSWAYACKDGPVFRLNQLSEGE